MKMMSSILLLLILSSCLCAATFVVNVTQSSYQAEEKQSITLEWTFTTKTQGTWKQLFIVCSLLAPDKPRVLYQVHEGVEIPESQDDQFSGRVQSDKDVLREGRIRLHVSRLRTEDSGLYQCDVKTEDGVNSGRCRLSVSVPVKVVGHDPIHAKVGDDVILPCHLEPPYDLTKFTIVWRFKDEIIHVHRSQTKDDEASDPKYNNRTFMFPDEFKKGNISLKLTKVTKEDEGNYICFVPKLERQARKGNVTLILDENGSQDNFILPGGPDPVVIGALVGGAVLAALIIIMIFFVVRHRKFFHVGGKTLNMNEGEMMEIAEKMSLQEMELKENLYRIKENKTKVNLPPDLKPLQLFVEKETNCDCRTRETRKDHHLHHHHLLHSGTDSNSKSSNYNIDVLF